MNARHNLLIHVRNRSTSPTLNKLCFFRAEDCKGFHSKCPAHREDTNGCSPVRPSHLDHKLKGVHPFVAERGLLHQAG
ncbi:hypothetical protein OIU74_006369 [Salix koriyanagi]|uniref:Uncharacterized protein n=1 Tax=Salix koriyanagi TaxID=2511006 RepID=A0A9Q0UE17_9ROSI|nr:hypothetical protein OIU74_006369 [Salix koriyanagi]